MAINRNRRKIPSLHMEERAVIRTWTHHGEQATSSKFYATALNFTQQGLQIYASSPLPVGEVLDIAISHQGQTRSYSLKGVAHYISPSDDGKGYLIDVTLVEDKHAGHWRRQFH